MDTHLVHWFRFEDPNMLNFDSITGLPQGTLTQLSDPGHVAGKLGRALNLMDGNPLFTVSNNFLQEDSWTISFFFKYKKRQDYGRFFQIPNLIYLITRYNNVVWLELYSDVRHRNPNLFGDSSLWWHITITAETTPADSNKMQITIYSQGTMVDWIDNPKTVPKTRIL